MNVLRTDNQNEDFVALVKLLDQSLAITDGEDHAFYDQFNKLDLIKHAVVVSDGGEAIACGAIKQYDEKTVEVKRMFTLPEHRGKGLATQILGELEAWAGELGFKRCILETGNNQKAALALYRNRGYLTIPNYGQYEGVENSYCFEKRLS